MDQIEAEIITALDELLADEPLDEEGRCPWCEEIRAPWAGVIRSDHLEYCPWRRLRLAFPRWVAD